MTRRPGLSMTEVLVALFILAIGVIGVLTLFPVGAVQMGQALKDQRCAEAATQADAYLRWYWRHEIVEKGGGSEPLWTELEKNKAAQPNGPSPPVFVDPMGAVAGMGAPAGTSIQRVNLNLIGSDPALALRTCTLLDGFTYDQTGIPSLTGGQVDRENRYNWLWVVQRPDNSKPFTANMTVVVFNKRVHQYTPSMTETNNAGATFTTAETGVTLGGGGINLFQRGGWLADVSATSNSIQLCDFYRAVSVNGTNVELQAAARPPLGGGSRSTPAAEYLPGVAEVFERPQLTDDNGP